MEQDKKKKSEQKQKQEQISNKINKQEQNLKQVNKIEDKDNDKIQEIKEKKISKNEQKRKAKQQRLAKQKAQKAQKLAKKEQENKGKKNEQILDPTLYYQNRSKVIKEMKLSKDPYPYPHKFNAKMTVNQFIEKFDPICQKGQFHQGQTSLAARITNIRKQGKKLVFYDLKGDGLKLQVMCNADRHKGQKQFQQAHTIFRRGDIIGVRGCPGRTTSGQLSIAPGELVLLSPCLHMLPVALKDPQTRFRKRYLDLILNDKSRETFITRAKVIGFIRQYLNQLNFIEVQTPMMNMIPGGANARPFVTYHNDLNMKLFMRVAPQLYLKQCIVGGLQRVFQIGKNFRNESMDQTHNPQYTSCQFYMAYADYNDLINITQDMLSKMILKLTGSYILKIHPDIQNLDKILEIDFSPPWKRISMLQELQTILQIKFPKEIHTEQARQFLDNLCKKYKIKCGIPRTNVRLIDKLVGQFLQSKCINPTFIIQHPQIMSPLAKYHRNKPGLTERFQLFINCHQFANAYTELNDPFVQKQLFEDQVKEKDKGDSETMYYDEVFVNALQHALPPTAGWGLGIDRTVMLLTDQIRIQEVLLFPAMKPIEQKQKEEQKEQVQENKLEKIQQKISEICEKKKGKIQITKND